MTECRGAVETGTAYECVHAVCCYYERSDEQSITCEGIAPGTWCRHIFFDRIAKKAHFEAYCASMGSYSACPIAQVLEAKYSEGNRK